MNQKNIIRKISKTELLETEKAKTCLIKLKSRKM